MKPFEIFQRLGGASKVARDLDEKRNNIYKWIERGSIPERVRWRILHVYGEGVFTAEQLGLPELERAE